MRRKGLSSNYEQITCQCPLTLSHAERPPRGGLSEILIESLCLRSEGIERFLFPTSAEQAKHPETAREERQSSRQRSVAAA
jgi:hypothetical protein